MFYIVIKVWCMHTEDSISAESQLLVCLSDKNMPIKIHHPIPIKWCRRSSCGLN